MKLKKLHATFVVVGMVACNLASAQLFIDNAQFFIQPGATVTVQGNVTSNTDILGTGLLQMKGTALQSINMNGFTIPNLEIDNATNVALIGAAKLSGKLTFTTGKLQLGANNFTLANTATFAGTPGTSKFIETNGTGQVLKLLTANVSLSQIPIGVGTVYRPAYITSTGTYSSASVGVRVVGAADPNKPPMISDYLSAYWPVTKTGVTGTVTVTGQYAAADLAAGTETNLRGYFYNGTDWASTSETHDAALNRVAAPIATATGEVYGMDKFVLSKTKVFLQGPYNSSLGLMSDALRTPTNLIPLTDPYRSAPFTTNFTHVANSVAETAAASVFADQASTNDNIVDWVFLELRNTAASPGNTVLQTRSALLKRNGDIVDVDGKSPVTFNNTANGNFAVAVRHRNHLGISADPTANPKALAEKKSTATALDLTVATDAQIYGPATAFNIVAGKNVMWSGNANFNANVRYNGLSNDKDYLFVTTLGTNPAAALVNVYNPADMNMNRTVRYTGLNNDKDVLFVSTLLSNPATVRTQALPN